MHAIPLLFASLPALAAAASSISSTGCGAEAPIALSMRQNVTLPSGRTYMYFLPATYNYTNPTPLIVSFHGATETADDQADLDLLTDPYFNTDHILVYPQSEDYDNNATHLYWQGSPNATADDVAYVGQVLDAVEADLCIDRTRVYATGKSQGAGMVGVLSCDPANSRRIAAFAPVSGAFYVGNVSCTDPTTVTIPCNPDRPLIPVMEFHGGNDSKININGGEHNGYCLPAIAHWIGAWAARDLLPTAAPAVEALQGSARRTEWGAGDAAGLVTWIYDGDHVNHDWPSTKNNSDQVLNGSPPASFNASSIIMAWFKKYSLPETYLESPNATATGSSTGSVPSSTTVPANAGSALGKGELLLGTICGIAVAGLVLL